MNEKLIAVVRLIAGLVTLVNLFLIERGITPIPVDEEQIAEFGSLGLAIAAEFWAWWKNNNITEAAIHAQEFKNITSKNKDDDFFEEEEDDPEEEE